VGHSQCLLALVPGQPPGSHRWHPGCRRCLLKGCERWFLPQRAQACYCSPACQDAARRWRRWWASQRYRATANGRQRRRQQARRYRDRLRQRVSVPDADPPTPDVEPATPAAGTEPPRTTDPPIEPATPAVGTEPPRTTDLPRALSAPAWASAQAKFPKKSSAGPATGPVVTSCSFPQCGVLIRNSVRAYVARRYGACASGKPASG